MNCEKCGEQIDTVLVNKFNYEGIDGYISVPLEDCEESAVFIDVDSDWTGYELTEDEMRETILCPRCEKFPFAQQEIQVYEIVRIVCFRQSADDDPQIQPEDGDAISHSEVTVGCEDLYDRYFDEIVNYIDCLDLSDRTIDELKALLLKDLGVAIKAIAEVAPAVEPARTRREYCPKCGADMRGYTNEEERI